MSPSQASEPFSSARAPLAPARTDHPQVDLEVKRSHFLGRAARADTEEEARAFISRIRSTYPDARHHCSAFLLAPQGAQPVERSSDDGEPSGTAGQPMLEVLRGSGAVNAVVVVTRYFGGTLLGTGGLVRAYSVATSRALAAASWVALGSVHLWEVRIPIAQAGRLEAELRALPAQMGIGTQETIWGPTHAVLTLTTTSPDAVALTEVLASRTQGQAVPEPAGSRLIETPTAPPATVAP